MLKVVMCMLLFEKEASMVFLSKETKVVMRCLSLIEKRKFVRFYMCVLMNDQKNGIGRFVNHSLIISCDDDAEEEKKKEIKKKKKV